MLRISLFWLGLVICLAALSAAVPVECAESDQALGGKAGSADRVVPVQIHPTASASPAARAIDSGLTPAAKSASRHTSTSKKKKVLESPIRPPEPGNILSPETAGRQEPTAAVAVPRVAGDWVTQTFPALHSSKELAAGLSGASRKGGAGARLVDPGQVQALLMPKKTLNSVGNYPAGPEGTFTHLDIEVSHSRHIFKLFGKSFYGKNQLLYECGVGLGSPGFPTPVGQYYVTHIYDDAPWWIPPPNRAWAAGQSPSRRIYGGTMAPLLKKRPVKEKKPAAKGEDLIEKKVRLDDYGYRFHGTNAPRSIGRNQSHGCVRMVPEDARKVAEIIKGYVGIAKRENSENGSFVILRAPVRLTIVR